MVEGARRRAKVNGDAGPSAEARERGDAGHEGASGPHLPLSTETGQSWLMWPSVEPGRCPSSRIVGTTVSKSAASCALSIWLSVPSARASNASAAALSSGQSNGGNCHAITRAQPK
jgi:hypothetical protein